jgi:hypothetical protein
MIASGGNGNTDDSKLPLRQIQFWINNYRASGLYEFTEAGREIDPQLVQDLGIVKLTSVDKSDSNCPNVPWGCKIKKVVIPKLIDLPLNRSLVFVGLIDKQTPIQLDHADTHIFRAATRFGKLFTRAYLVHNTLYVVTSDNAPSLKYINIRGVFENPVEVETYPYEGCDPKCYSFENDEYPMPARMYEYVLRKIMVNELQMSLQTVDDEINNARQENAKLQP